VIHKSRAHDRGAVTLLTFPALGPVMTNIL